jgi:hypothetical protein
MSIEIEPEKAQEPAGAGPAAPGPARRWWMRPAIHTALIGAVLGYLVGHWLGNFLSYNYARNALSDVNDFPIVLGYVLGTVGWLAGLGVFNDLFRQMAGKPVPVARDMVPDVVNGSRTCLYSPREDRVCIVHIQVNSHRGRGNLLIRVSQLDD